jgi:Tol biopolymer transport system component
MPLARGDRLGPYEIISQLGKGGMGEVWSARDSRVGRDVAVKVSEQRFTELFEREARAIAALNHPNICTLFDVGPNYLVMELIDGSTLAEWIARGPVPLNQALKIAKQIANALEAAHDKAIVHRDLKPANIKIRQDGSVKVLDFGLAKAGGEAHLTSGSRTVTLSTREGMILGSPGYMSPEQARGQTVDKRADIWAFGVVFYEMLTGDRLFDGPTISDSVAAILMREPDLTLVPERVRRLLRLCLDKDPNRRLRDISSVELLLEDSELRTAAPVKSRIKVMTSLAVAGLATITGMTAGWYRWMAPRHGLHPLTRLTVDLGADALEDESLPAAISPDGRRLVYRVGGQDGKARLAVRALDQSQAILLPGTENGSSPFFSPDGQWVGFFADGELKKTPVLGGDPVALSPVNDPQGASWGEDGSIVVASRDGPLSRLPAAGGTLTPLTKLRPGEAAHRWPQVIPGNEAILFTTSPTVAGQENSNIEALSLKTGEAKTLVRGGYYGRYIPGGYLVYVHQGALLGLRFDPERLEPHGIPRRLLSDLAASPAAGGGEFDFSAAPAGSGTFLYREGKPHDHWQIAWMDAAGKLETLIDKPGMYTFPRFSPDGRTLAVGRDVSNIYGFDIERKTSIRLASGNSPVFTPDGKHIVFGTSPTAGGCSLLWTRSDGSGEAQSLLKSPNQLVAGSFSPDGKFLAYFERAGTRGFRIWILPMETSDSDHPKPGRPSRFLPDATDDEMLPLFSPDGRWIAYQSDESGTSEIYVRPFPAEKGGKWQISSGGSQFSVWSKKRHELFFTSPDSRIMVVEYAESGDAFVPGKTRLWSDRQIFHPGVGNLDLAADGKRFAVLAMPETGGAQKRDVHVVILENFFDELQRIIPGWK